MKKMIVLSTLLLALAFASANSQAVECLKKGSWVNVTYTLKNGQKKNKRVQVGSGSGKYSCMGRCGEECGLILNRRYTKKCLIHDVCSREEKASGHHKDPNCGDEFKNAAPDWGWRSYRCPIQP